MNELPVVLLALGAAITLASFGGALSFWLELLSHFRAQYALGFLLLAALLAALKKWPLVVGALVLCGAHAALVLPVYSSGTTAKAAGARLRIVYLNVHTGNLEHDRVLAFVQEQSADVVLLVEVDDTWMSSLEPLREMYPTRIAQPRFDNFGIALFSKLAVEGNIETLGGPDAPPTIVARHPASSLTLIGTHPVPPIDAAFASRRNRQLDALAARAVGLEGPVVLVGDLNMTPWSPHFTSLLERSRLRDSRVGFGVHSSWPAPLPSFLRIPIDHCLVSPSVAVTSRHIGPSLGSDHLPLVVEVASSAPQTHGPGVGQGPTPRRPQ